MVLYAGHPRGRGGGGGCCRLGEGVDVPDTGWHAVWIRAKRCRYAVEAVAPVFGRQAGRFAAAIAAVRDILGDHQGTVVAETWLRAARAALFRHASPPEN
jgi:CHAD domain-containing protein